MNRHMPRRLVVVSNRLPAAVEKGEGSWRVGPVAGGLVTAMEPVMEKNRGLWVGWPGCDSDAPFIPLLEQWSREHSYDLLGVPLSAKDVNEYYHGFANQTLWPLFHDFLGRAQFNLTEWLAYNRVNDRFAATIVDRVRAQDFVWVHDYQLLLVGQALRLRGLSGPLSFFLHIPFPSLDLFRRMPWHREVIEALLAYDDIGFQTLHDRRNFVQCVRELLPAAEIVVRGRETMIEVDGRRVRTGHFPISIDFHSFHAVAATPEVAAAAHSLRELYHCDKLILGVDRLDYTKGIIERFLAFERALEKHPELQGNVSLIQLVVPSRTNVPEYQRQRSALEGLTGRINGRFTQRGWVPIHYMFRRMDRQTLLAHYRACEIALVTPLRDGMNLVAKEYCASTIDGNGVLILSEFAGAADQLAPHALCVNPYDREQTADAIHRAFTMRPEERRMRMKALRAEVRRNDVNRWLRQFLAATMPPPDDTGQTERRDLILLAESESPDTLPLASPPALEGTEDPAESTAT